jgi:hypothetical protein
MVAGTTLRALDSPRPVSEEFYTNISPLSPGPTVLTDYHGIDVQLATFSGSLNAFCSMYAMEAKSVHGTTDTINRVHGGLLEAVVQNGGQASEIYGCKAFNQVLTGGNVTVRSASFYALNPVVDGTSTVNIAVGLYCTGWAASNNPRVTLSLAILVSDGESRFQDSVVCTGGGILANAATDGFLYIPTMAGTPTGVPTTKPTAKPIVYDTTANKLWIYNGAWRGVVVA